MGNSTSHPIFWALNELLRSKDLKLKKSTLERFLEECDANAPWFGHSGNLTISSWDKLGRDLDFAAQEGTLKGGVRPIWKLVRSCLEDQRCTDAVKNGQAALEMLQEERSVCSHSERGSAKEKGIYPSLKGTGTSSSEEDSEPEEVQLASRLEKIKLGEKGKNHKESQFKGAAVPSVPPPYHAMTEDPGRGQGASCCSLIWWQVLSEMQLAFPVFTDAQGQRYYEALDFKMIKALAESVRMYGVSASFTLTLVESLIRLCVTPTDWTNLASACLSPGQYLEWKAFLSEFTEEQAAINQAIGGPERRDWNKEMLLGLGPYSNQQTGYPVQLFDQINQIAIRAWKSIPNKGEVSGNLTKIVQGPMEPFSDFVTRVLEAAEIETWTKIYRELGGPLTNAGLAAAVVQLTRGAKGNLGAYFRCGKAGHIKRNCPERKTEGDTGGSSFSRRQPGLCPKCKKGKQWANECRSVKDINGRPLEAEVNSTLPKNAQRAPCPQGPQIYGAMETRERRWEQGEWPTLQHQRSRGEPLQAQQDWTSAPPPDSY
ncbi:endogenous retrovirus group K member 113 Gag polyprotein-like [Cricetulus griseus]|uniref:Endogenous retrovirus group K member 113 Gag polyprotein-like n=1 Tax=Cricetulus griseus TaxID=10029 RepID=A0A9J7GKP3_CRIGR|nr:endogenous retrovirus group K member 113 Gag polyprotein-like [Cricetulus griseus]